MKRLIMILLSTLSLTAFAQKKVAVYVMGEDDGINKVLGSKLVSAIARSKEYTAIERTAAFLSELNKEQKYQRTGAVDDSELSRLGKQFGVQYICVAAVSEAFNEKYLSVRLIDVESAQVERTASSNGTILSLSDVVNAANAVSDELLSSIGAKLQSNAQKVAIYIVKNDAAKNIGRVLGDKLVQGFTNSGRYIAIERTNAFLSQLSKEQNYQRTGAVDDKDISRLGKQFGVKYVCVADVSDVLGEKYISSRLIDVETAEVMNTHDVGGLVNNMSDCVRMANEIATNLSKGSFHEQFLERQQAYTDSIKNITEGDILADRHDNYKDLSSNYVDLGLPSGILWKDVNEKTKYDYYSAMDKFGNKLPTAEQWEELKKYCTWEWKKNGYRVIGPNNKSIFLRATFSANDGSNGITGRYWAYKAGVSETSARCFSFDSNNLGMDKEMCMATGAVCLVNSEREECLKVASIDYKNEGVDGLLEFSAAQLPEFPGGYEAFRNFINENIKYPKSAKEQGISGSVLFSFIVEKSGRITNIHILRAPKGGGLSEEVIRVLKIMPNWRPGREDNEIVRSYFADRVKFILD